MGAEAAFEVSPELVSLALAAALGLFLGLEREWSNKPAGIRTFTIITIIAAAFAIVDSDLLLAAGAGLVLIHSTLLGLRGLLDDDEGLLLTTTASMMLAYGVGVLIGYEYYIESVAIAVISSFLLVLKRELHEFADDLSKEEMRSAAEFAILAFVIYPILPNETIDPWEAINPRTVWMLVVAVSALGFVNYIILKKYGGKGVAFTGFFGGLVNSTAVIGEMADRAKKHPEIGAIAVGAILLADAAMAVRNLVIAGVFLPELGLLVAIPLLLVTVAGILLSYYYTDWNQEIDADVKSPFSLQNALKFGGLFLVVILLSVVAEDLFGGAGFIITSFVGGLVSSGSVTTTAVLLVETGQIGHATATAGIVAGTVASIIVKVVLAASIARSLVKPVSLVSFALIAAAGGGVAVVYFVL